MKGFIDGFSNFICNASWLWSYQLKEVSDFLSPKNDCRGFPKKILVNFGFLATTSFGENQRPPTFIWGDKHYLFHSLKRCHLQFGNKSHWSLLFSPWEIVWINCYHWNSGLFLLRIRQILNQHLSVKLKVKKLFRLTEHGIDLKYEIIWKMCFFNWKHICSRW